MDALRARSPSDQLATCRVPEELSEALGSDGATDRRSLGP